jgi:stress response protein SCP2
VNDDRKVKINLSELMKGSKPGKMILLTVRAESVRPPKAGEYDRAWYRVVNEDTNQTVDYKNIKDVQKPEGFDEDSPIPEGEEGGDKVE